MYIENRVTRIKRSVMTRVVELLFQKAEPVAYDRIPRELISRTGSPHRCCVEKDREIIRQRVIAVLGFGLEDSDQVDSSLLSDYVRSALPRTAPESPILSFIDDACKTCVKANYYITGVCRNCVAKPCIDSCPKKAIEADDRQATILSQKCINCGICQKVCPYHAIVFVPVPCEESCPAGAIQKNAEGREFIDYDKCIYCGKCIQACPFGAVVEKSQLVEVVQALLSDRSVVAMVAPAIAGQFEGGMARLAGALRGLGFDTVVEVATGADTTAATEAAEFEERMAQGAPLMGTSCCPAYIEAVHKHSPAFKQYVSHAKTPAAYTASAVRQAFPEAVSVFIGPCVAKRAEGLKNPEIDYVLTFEELAAMFDARKIVPASCEPSHFELGSPSTEGRGFPMAQGVAAAVKKRLEEQGSTVDLRPVYIDGFNRKSIRLLNTYAESGCPGNLVEVMSCEGGCIAGPGVICDPRKGRTRLLKAFG